ncbi:UDP-phosphate galactose phosphotransferase [Tatumella morbirosei]|uniref:UDP-phosphate galactose phosphotransferase n=2 Tax=Tatumella morbirosei TaxID=642227 RepID=A0A095TF16_9GAMM|nr:UDP-phosphate galactose phosphotransferase [Tatumella morbirosei]
MRYFDVAVSALSIALLSPVLITAYLAIASTGRSPLYSHRRIGQNNKAFGCYKFTSMKSMDQISESDKARVKHELSAYGKVNDDPRITRIGKLIRKTSIDELPQLINVLRGDMTLIGPRPVTEPELKYYGRRSSSYLSVKPGLTGLWQVSGRSDTSYKRRVAIDHYFAINRTRKLKMFIFLKTFYVVVAMKGSQ